MGLGLWVKAISKIETGMLELDAGYNIKKADAYVARMLRYSQKELVGVNIFSLVPKELRKVFADLLAEDVKSFEMELIRKDGGRVSILVWPDCVFENGIFKHGTLSVMEFIEKCVQA
ncbi:MAG: PAS domain-containing protein [Nitrososphaerota archaeon]|nr:PAS domain-containing protein [Candidatus Bathyarchaeota archaeon]MDW8048938.1 PAS domain-containing protein [Nitrososphaerota archaeon]